MSKRPIGKFAIALTLALLANAPAGAGSGFSRQAAVAPITPVVSGQASGGLPESMDWLLMLGGFGLLGLLSRRGTPHPLQDPINL